MIALNTSKPAAINADKQLPATMGYIAGCAGERTHLSAAGRGTEGYVVCAEVHLERALDSRLLLRCVLHVAKHNRPRAIRAVEAVIMQVGATYGIPATSRGIGRDGVDRKVSVLGQGSRYLAWQTLRREPLCE